eukprot:11678159-Ditylum_brightwellii.AAC.1
MEEGSLVGRNLHPWFLPPSDVDLVYRCGGGRTLTLATGGWLLRLLLALTLGDALFTHDDLSYAAGGILLLTVLYLLAALASLALALSGLSSLL